MVKNDLLLDTSAVLALLLDEAGADWVEERLYQARSGRFSIFGSFVTLTEVDYTTRRGESAEQASLYLALLTSWPVTWVHSSLALCRRAAELKANHSISFADSFVAATALSCEATLVHKDPEFEALRSIVPMKPLPFKRSGDNPGRS